MGWLGAARAAYLPLLTDLYHPPVSAGGRINLQVNFTV
jgi:hypothetical protein